MEKKRYLINEVAQRLGISAAAIRLYEKKGLFSSKKDEKNGYRYYYEEDIYKIWSVAYHRSYDLSLQEIDALKHSQSLEDILDFFEQQKKDSREAIEAEHRRIRFFDYYNDYVRNSLRCGEEPVVRFTEKLHFYDKKDVYRRSGPGFPAAGFCYVVEDEQEEPEMYGLVYDHDMDMVEKEGLGHEVFMLEAFRCVNSVVCVEGTMDIQAALNIAKSAAEKAGYQIKEPYYISYLLSCGELDDSKHYFEVMLPLA